MQLVEGTKQLSSQEVWPQLGKSSFLKCLESLEAAGCDIVFDWIASKLTHEVATYSYRTS